MQVFSREARVPKSRLIVAAMLDLQNSTLPNLPLLLESKMAAMAFARPKNTPQLQANNNADDESTA